jgi:hypothetical protein
LTGSHPCGPKRQPIHYTLYFLDADGHQATTVHMACLNDIRALTLVHQFCSDFAMELRNGARLVKRYPGQALPSQAAGRE